MNSSRAIKISNGNFFIDRDPEMFKLIIQYLRANYLRPLDHPTLQGTFQWCHEIGSSDVLFHDKDLQKAFGVDKGSSTVGKNWV